MNSRLINRVVAGAVFLISATQFFATAQPSVSFWDPGELSAAAYMLQVPHPPGGPLFSLVGRIFYLLPLPGDPGFRMNAVSALCSAFSVLFLYLIAVRLIRNFRPGREESTRESLTTYASAAVGALALSFSDTFWFSGVESNYFAAATLLFSAILWLMLVWHEKADHPRNGRFLLLIAYLVGLSAGVHLMSVLTIFTVAMVYVFTRFVTDDGECRKTAPVLAGHILLLLVVTFAMWSGQTSQQPPSPDEFHAYDRKFMAIMAGISVAYVALFRKKVFRWNSLYAPIAIASAALFVAYPGVIKKLPELIHSLSRDDSTLGIVILFAVLAVLGFLVRWSGRLQKSILHVCSLGVLFIVVGFSTYTMIVTRANHHPPMNENNPRDFSSLLTYLNREQYGDFPIFKRRWTSEEDRQRTFTNYSSDFDFFLRYQMSHMFNRYLFFNFIGRDSRDQDAAWSWKSLLGIPFIVGLFGLYTHFRKDWKMATAFLVLFVIVGYLIAFYQNQQEPQPRERDYFYAGAYFVFSVWIAIGVKGLVEALTEIIHAPQIASIAVAGTLLLAVLSIPVNMFRTNLYTHDRSKNWFPWDYAYNLLQSCEKDAILFTNGDNDTFPLWFLQDVEGVRRDVRVVCLSLVNTPWYIQQLKDAPYYREAKAVPISLSDARIAGLGGWVPWQPQKVVLPVPRAVLEGYSTTDTAVSGGHAFGRRVADTAAEDGGKIEFFMRNTAQVGQVKAIRTQDLMVKNIIETTRWTRPIYFAATCSPDSKIGTDEYLRYCGMAWRLEPFKASDRDMGIDPDVLEASLFNEPATFFTTPHEGYKFRSIADSNVYFDENEERMTLGLLSTFRGLAVYDIDFRNDTRKGAAVLERMENVIPLSRMSIPIELGVDFARLNFRAGRMEQFNDISVRVDRQFRALTAGGPGRNLRLYGPMLQLYDLRNDYRGQLDALNSLVALYPNDPTLRQKIDSLKSLVNRQ